MPRPPARPDMRGGSASADHPNDCFRRTASPALNRVGDENAGPEACVVPKAGEALQDRSRCAREPAKRSESRRRTYATASPAGALEEAPTTSTAMRDEQ